MITGHRQHDNDVFWKIEAVTPAGGKTARTVTGAQLRRLIKLGFKVVKVTCVPRDQCPEMWHIL